MYKSSHTDIAEVEVLPGNVIYITVKKGAELNLENAKRMIKGIDAMLDANNPLRAGIFDLSNITYINEEARTYLSSGEDTTGTTVGIALISTSLLGTTIGNLFLTLSDKTAFPVKFFYSPIRAEHWIRTKLVEARQTHIPENRKVA